MYLMFEDFGAKVRTILKMIATNCRVMVLDSGFSEFGFDSQGVISFDESGGSSRLELYCAR